MAVCSRCGGQLNPNERFCGNCGLDTQADGQQTTQQTAVQPTVPQQTAVQPTAPQPTAPQPVYMPPAAQRAGIGPSGGSDGVARAAMGLGIAGGLLGILWGALGPYLSLKVPSYIGWFAVFGNVAYPTGISTTILLVVGLALGVVAILGASAATTAVWVTRILLPVCGLAGFLLGPSWLLPGTLLLTGGGLAIAARTRG